MSASKLGLEEREHKVFFFNNKIMKNYATGVIRTTFLIIMFCIKIPIDYKIVSGRKM